MTYENKQDDSASPVSREDKGVSRRGFFKRFMYGGAAVGAAGGAAKVADDAVDEAKSEAVANLQKAYEMDVAPGDKIIAEREHVLMTDEEKENMLNMFIENYEKSHSDS